MGCADLPGLAEAEVDAIARRVRVRAKELGSQTDGFKVRVRAQRFALHVEAAQREDLRTTRRLALRSGGVGRRCTRSDLAALQPDVLVRVVDTAIAARHDGIC